MKKYKHIVKIILVSINIALICGAIGALFNIVNPLGIEIKEKQSVQISDKIKEYLDSVNKKKKTAKKTNLKKIVNPVTSEVKINYSVTEEIKLINDQNKEIVIQSIDLKKAKELFDNGVVIFVDARPEYRYIEKHIKGAVSLSASRFIVQYEQVKDQITKDTPLVVYCNNSGCKLSEQVAKYLKEKGYTQLMVFTGGWDEWVENQYPTTEGVEK